MIKEEIKKCVQAADAAIKEKKWPEAEKQLKEVIKLARQMYEEDKENNDLQLGAAFHRLGKFYSMLIHCDKIPLKPVVLDERAQNLFKVCEALFHDAIACTLQNGKLGKAVYVDFHSLVMHDFLVLYFSVGKYDEAIKHGKNGIQLEKAIYEKFDDKAHAFRLAERMTALATAYALKQEVVKAMETLEDSIFVLEEHEKEEPIRFGLMLGRSYLTLAGNYERQPEEAAQAEKTFLKGYAKIEEVQELSQGKILDDVITANIVLGDFYKRKEKPQSKEYYKDALHLAEEYKEKNQNAKYDYLIAKLKVQVR